METKIQISFIEIGLKKNLLAKINHNLTYTINWVPLEML